MPVFGATMVSGSCSAHDGATCKGRPCRFRVRWPLIVALVALLSSVSLPMGARATEAAYRVAGIIALETGPYLGLLELPDGTQLLVRPGTRIGSDAIVVDISERRIRLAFGARVVDLDLEGAENEGELVAGELVGSSAILQASSNPSYGVAVRDVNAKALTDLIDRTAADGGASVATTTSARVGPAPDGNGATVSGPVGNAIDLPDGGQLIAVNGQFVHTSAQGMQLIRVSVAAGSTTTLTMSRDGGQNWERVYLNPREGAGTSLEEMQQSSQPGLEIPVKSIKDSRS
jgi:hypothetical protein